MPTYTPPSKTNQTQKTVLNSARSFFVGTHTVRLRADNIRPYLAKAIKQQPIAGAPSHLVPRQTSATARAAPRWRGIRRIHTPRNYPQKQNPKSSEWYGGKGQQKSHPAGARWDKKIFFWTVNGPFSFLGKENGGLNSRPAGEARGPLRPVPPGRYRAGNIFPSGQ